MACMVYGLQHACSLAWPPAYIAISYGISPYGLSGMPYGLQDGLWPAVWYMSCIMTCGRLKLLQHGLWACSMHGLWPSAWPADLPSRPMP